MPEDTADVPTAREIRVECQCAVDQAHHRADVLAKIGQHEGNMRQNGWVVAGRCEGAPGEFGALPTVRRRVFAPEVHYLPKTAECGQGESGPVARIARDRL